MFHFRLRRADITFGTVYILIGEADYRDETVILQAKRTVINQNICLWTT